MLKKARAEAKAGAQNAKAARDDPTDFAQGIRDSSRQIWLAGLGAFSRVQAEGMKMFETLVEQGQGLESRTKRAASETAAAAAGIASQKAKEMQAMAGGTWDKLEQVFEDRVARALSKLGVHTQSDVEQLSRRVEALSNAVNELIKAGGGRPMASTNDPKKAGRRAPRAGKSSTGSPGTSSADAKPDGNVRRKAGRKRAAV